MVAVIVKVLARGESTAVEMFANIRQGSLREHTSEGTCDSIFPPMVGGSVLLNVNNPSAVGVPNKLAHVGDNVTAERG